MASLAVGVFRMIEMNIRPILGGMAAGALPRPVTVWRKVAPRAVIVAIVIKYDLLPAYYVMAYRAVIQIMFIWGRMADGTVLQHITVVDIGNHPGIRIMAFRAGSLVMLLRWNMAAVAIRIIGMVEVHLGPACRAVAVRTPAQIMLLRFIVTGDTVRVVFMVENVL